MECGSEFKWCIAKPDTTNPTQRFREWEGIRRRRDDNDGRGRLPSKNQIF